jgi:hypothetical protein
MGEGGQSGQGSHDSHDIILKISTIILSTPILLIDQQLSLAKRYPLYSAAGELSVLEILKGMVVKNCQI